MNRKSSDGCTSGEERLVKVEDLTRVYMMGQEKIYAMNEVNLTVERGDFLVVSGPSGSGKSTFLNLVGCIDKPTSGTVYLDNQSTSELSEVELAKLRRERIGLIFQSFNLIPVLSAHENVEYPLLLQDKDDGNNTEQVENLLQEVGLEGMKNRRPNELSGGQRQRVAIARALVGDPELVLADEPTANLDSTTGEKVMDLMKELNEEYCVAFIVATHDPLVFEYADREVEILDGKMEEVTESEEVEDTEGLKKEVAESE